MHGGNLAHVEDRHRRFHHRPHAGLLRTAHAGMDLRHVHDVAGPCHLGNEDGIRVHLRRHLQVLHPPWRVQPIDADHQFAPAITTGPDGRSHLGARLCLGIGRHRILEVEDERIGGKRPCLFKRPLIGAGHVENAASGSQGHVNSIGVLQRNGKRRNARMEAQLWISRMAPALVARARFMQCPAP